MICNEFFRSNYLYVHKDNPHQLGLQYVLVEGTYEPLNYHPESLYIVLLRVCNRCRVSSVDITHTLMDTCTGK